MFRPPREGILPLGIVVDNIIVLPVGSAKQNKNGINDPKSK
jgi:hypothetical protein